MRTETHLRQIVLSRIPVAIGRGYCVVTSAKVSHDDVTKRNVCSSLAFLFPDC